MRILVTGVTGYIGSAAARALHDGGHEVFGLTRSSSSPRARAVQEAGVLCRDGDVGDPETYRRHLVDVDVVVHTVVDRDRPVGADEDLFAELQRLRSTGRVPHLVYTTGCSVYGEHDHAELTEDTPTDAANPRAQLEDRLRESGLPHTIVRPAFVFGGDDRSSILGRWLQEAADDDVAFFGDREKVWSWVHVEDLAAGYVLIIDQLPVLNRSVFLFADLAPVPALETVEACRAARGASRPIRFASNEQEDPEYRVFDRDEIVDSSAARRVLGWRAGAPTVLEHVRGPS